MLQPYKPGAIEILQQNVVKVFVLGMTALCKLYAYSDRNRGVVGRPHAHLVVVLKGILSRLGGF